jgi:nucleotide-binding universal stress UspA family protein
LLGLLFGPVIVVGPDARTDRSDLRGALLVTVDGSPTSESALPLAAAWGIGLEATPWITLVLEPNASGVSDVGETSYPNRLAQKLSSDSHHPVEFEVLRGKNPATAVCDFARSSNASLIVTSTHGRSGLARIRAGSVAMGIVHRAPCPVVLNRPPDLSE